MIDNNIKKADLKVGDTILSVKNLCKYFGDNKVLNGINIDIKKGDVVAIVGPSGCGKSTFLRCLNLLEQPNAGEIVFEGEYVYKLYSLYAKEKINEITAEIAKLKKELYHSEKPLSNLEVVSKTLELRKAIIESGADDPFLPTFAKDAPTDKDIEAAQKVARVLQEAVDESQGDEALFMARLNKIIR